MKRFRDITILLIIAFSIFVAASGPAYAETEKDTVTLDDLLGIRSSVKIIGVKSPCVGVRINSIKLKGTAKDYYGFVTGPEMHENDVIIEVEEKEFKSWEEFLDVWNKAKIKDSFQIKVLRGGKEKTVTLRKDDFQNWSFTGKIINLGVTVNAVDAGGPAYKAGIKKYDYILRMNQKYIADQEYLDKMVEECKPDETLTFEILREDESINVEIKLENPEIEIRETEILNNQANTGEKIPLVSIKATGNLDINSSFIWTKKELINGKEISLKKHNSIVGLTVENSYNEETGEYTSILWADKIRQEADGEYFCQIKDRFNAIVESDSIKITVQ